MPLLRWERMKNGELGAGDGLGNQRFCLRCIIGTQVFSLVFLLPFLPNSSPSSTTLSNYSDSSKT